MKGFVWEFIRLCRSQPSATDKDAVTEYQAGLRQFEELMDAATVVSAVCRPTLLYYAMSQAGKALMANAGITAPPRGHGLTVVTEADEVLSSTVEPRNGEFQTVANIVASAPLPTSVELGALAASLPEIAGLMMDDTWPHALELSFGTDYTHITHNIPEHHWFEINWPDNKPQGPEEAGRILRNYAVIGDLLGDVTDTAVLEVNSSYDPQAGWICIPARATHAEMNAVVPEYRVTNRHWVRPNTKNGELLPSPLMTWWALLYGLSHFARYRPSRWVQATNINHSAQAHIIDRILNRAVSALPHLVLNALVTSPILIPQLLPSIEPFAFLP